MFKQLTYLIVIACLISQGCKQENRKLSNTDASIIKIAVLDWYKDSGSRGDLVLDDEVGSDLLVLSPTFDETSPLQIEMDVEPKKISADIVKSFTKRNLHTYRLTDLQIENVGVRILDPPYDLENSLGEFSRNYPKAKGYIFVSIPGYSTNNDFAMVRFQVGPSYHGVSVTYFLQKVDESWTIQWKDISRYM